MKQRTLRWIFYTWKTIKAMVLIGLFATVILVVVGFGLLQMNVTKRYISFKTNQWLEQTYNGQIRIGKITGTLPLNAVIQDITVTHPDTLIHLKSLQLSISYADVSQNRIRIRSLIADQLYVNADSTLRDALTRSTIPQEDIGERPIGKWIFEFPNVTLVNSHVIWDTLDIRNIQLHTFAELGPEKSFVDVSNLTFNLPTISDLPFQLSGQVYRDLRFLEFNAIRLDHANSQLRFGVVGDMFLDSLPVWKVDVDSSTIVPSEWKWANASIPDISEPVKIHGLANGTGSGFEIRELSMAYKALRIQTDATILHPLDPQKLVYEVRLRNASVNSKDLADWVAVGSFPSATVSGVLSGNATRSESNIRIQSYAGLMTYIGSVNWSNGVRLNSRGTFRDINTRRIREDLPDSDINGRFSFVASGTNMNQLVSTASIDIRESEINSVRIDSVGIDMEGSGDLYDLEIGLHSLESVLDLTATMDLSGEEPRFVVKGSGRQVDLSAFLPVSRLAKTDLDIRYQLNLRGGRADRLYGSFSFDVDRAVVGGIKQKAHQLYMDLDSPDQDIRTLRFTSNMADATVLGDIRIDQFGAMGLYWARWLTNQANEQFLLQEPASLAQRQINTNLEDVQITVEATLKDLRLLNAYAPMLPPLASRSEVNLLVNATPDRLLINGGIRGDSIIVGNIRTERSNLQISAQFRYMQDLSEYSQFRMQLAAGLMKVGNFEMREYQLDTYLLNDTLRVSQLANRIGQNNQLRNSMTATLGDSSLTVTIDEFRFSNQNYVWESPGKPKIIRDRHGNIDVIELSVYNDDQIIDIGGRLSSNEADSMIYKFENVNLGRLSNLIGGRFRFAGTLNALFSTKDLAEDPSINGRIDVDRFLLNERPFGDLTFTSRLNPEFGRFDTQLLIRTDSIKYAQEMRRTGSRGNDIDISGYVSALDQDGRADSTFVMNVDVKRADLWIVNLFNPDLFQTIEGSVQGNGWFTGTFSSFDFDARFDIQQARVVPYFLLTDYRASGPLRVSRKGGLVLEDILVTDRFGGRGQLTGTLDFNDFKPDKEIDITMVMSNLQFLNNTFTPEVPFYGVASGTGTISLTGRTSAPFMQTRGQIVTSAASRIAIPFLDATSVQEQSRFLEFVTSFDSVYVSQAVPNTTPTALPNAAAVAASGNRFVELFTLNLSFFAPQGSTVQLVFDPLTGEILNAQGSGSVQIRMEDEQFNVFGTFNVNQGDYTFVAGDIFVRRFDLRDGGTIVWEGPADNARLNVLAAYRSRPDIRILRPVSALEAVENTQRIPVDLILSITGTLQSIQNDFYFEFPNAIDITQNSTELTTLNSEEQKLIQATSLLFTGGFLPPTQTEAGDYGQLTGNLQARGLGQLLSSQVNTLINSRLSFLDVDFNFSGFDQTDIGVAIRLFNDRLILRGESQFSQSAQGQTGGASLGDFGVSYQINRALSIEVFHRRDPTLAELNQNQTNVQSINGVGLEAAFQFNTWREFRQRIWGSIRRFFGSDRLSNPDTTNTALR